jgi:hypothetical protein
MKLISSLIILVIIQPCSYSQKHSKDSLCLLNLNQAKYDYESGLHKFCINATWDLPFARMYDILDSICKTKNLILTPYPYTEHDVGFDPYTCYSDFMDKMLKKKYGQNFKDVLINKADSIFKTKHINDTIPAYFCDKRPTYYKDNETLIKDFFFYFSMQDSCNYIINCSSCDFRVLFIVDLMGHSSNFEIYNSTITEKDCVDFVKGKIIEALKKIDNWIPGELDNRKIISYGDILVNIKNNYIY